MRNKQIDREGGKFADLKAPSPQQLAWDPLRSCPCRGGTAEHPDINVSTAVGRKAGEPCRLPGDAAVFLFYY